MLDCIQSTRFLWRKPFLAYLLLESICSSDYEILLLIPIKKNGRRMKMQNLYYIFLCIRRKMYDGKRSKNTQRPKSCGQISL